MAKPIRISSNRNETFSDGVPSFRILAPGESWGGEVSELHLDHFKGVDSTGVTTSDEALTLALNCISNNGTIYLGTGTYYFSEEYVIKKNVRIVGQGKNNTIVKYIPTNSNGIFLTFTGVNASTSILNEEGQLKAPGLASMRLESTRQIRANCVKFIKADKIYLFDLDIEKFKGFSINAQRCREWDIIGVQTRFNGYLDPSDPSLDVWDVIWESTDGTGDSTNYTRTLNLALIYSFSGLLRIKDSVKIDISNVMFHVFQEGNTSEETNILAAFPLYNDVAAEAGFDSSGNPKNEYAALHLSPGSAASNVSGRTFDTRFKYCPKVRIDNSQVKLSSGELVDGRSGMALWIDNSSEVLISAFSVQATASSQYSSSFTFSNDTLTVSSKCPETGTPVEISSTGTIPTGISARTVYFIIKLSATTCKLASSYANALAGTNVSLSGGSGTHTVTSRTGYGLLVTKSSRVYVSPNGLIINDGYQAAFSDSSSQIRGTPITGDTFSQGAVFPQTSSNQALFVGRNLDFTSTSDQAFTKVFGGRRYIVKEVLGICRSGGATVACAGGIYTAASKGGSQVIASSQSWLNLSAAGKYVSATLPSLVTTDTLTSGETSEFPLYLSLTTGSSTSCIGDIFIFGVIVD